MTQKTAEEILEKHSAKMSNGQFVFSAKRIIEAMEEYAAQFKPAPLSKEIQQWMEEQAKILGKEGTAPDKETPDWLETDIKRGMKAMYDLLFPEIEELKDALEKETECVEHMKELCDDYEKELQKHDEEAIDFGKFLTKNGYELYGDGWALQKGKRCGKTNEQLYEQFKAQLAEQKR